MALDLASIADKAAKIAFDAAGTAIKNASYVEIGAADYDPDSGVTQLKTNLPIRVLLEAASDRDVSKFSPAIVVEDNSGMYKATIIASELTTVPKTQDEFYVFDTDVTYKIAGVRPGDPTTAIYEMILVEPS